MKCTEYIWIFVGYKGAFPSGVFLEKVVAEKWIDTHNLSGVLTKYPLDEGVYEWAIEKGYFSPEHEKHKDAEFIASFSCASMEHYHYGDDGV